MEELEYGNKIIVSKGVFAGCKGIFFRIANSKDYQGSSNIFFREENLKDCVIEVFFETQKVECPEEIVDYFKDYLFNDDIPKKITSTMIIISGKDIVKVDN